MKQNIFITMILLFSMSCSDIINEENVKSKSEETISTNSNTASNVDINQLTYLEVSQELLNTIKRGGDAHPIVQKLANANRTDLKNELNTDHKKLAFWVNTYNGLIQTVLKKQPDLYNDRNTFFKAEQLNVAGKATSFDEIEHGIIRSSTAKLSKGYLPKIFNNDFVKDFRVKDKDGRIHFMLNCGAKDCPPVFVFSAENYNAEADRVASAYLTKVSTYDASKKTVKTSPLFNWFTGDFGIGKRGVKDMLAKYQIIPQEHDDVDVEYLDYDWTLDLDNFSTVEMALK